MGIYKNFTESFFDSCLQHHGGNENLICDNNSHSDRLPYCLLSDQSDHQPIHQPDRLDFSLPDYYPGDLYSVFIVDQRLELEEGGFHINYDYEFLLYRDPPILCVYQLIPIT